LGMKVRRQAVREGMLTEKSDARAVVDQFPFVVVTGIRVCISDFNRAGNAEHRVVVELPLIAVRRTHGAERGDSQHGAGTLTKTLHHSYSLVCIRSLIGRKLTVPL